MRKITKYLPGFMLVSVINLMTVTGLYADADSSGTAPQPPNCSDDPACQRTSWKEEFERICIQTEIATSLTHEQLRKLISDSDELLIRLQQLDQPQAKIYIFRIRNCREFFAYALQL